MEMLKPAENKTITIYDIAREAGVSPATVSRVLTNNANVRKEKKERVQFLIEKYNFKPNALARGLSDTRSKVIGIIAADVRNPFYAAVFVACEIAAKEAGYTVLLCNSLGITAQEVRQLEMLEEQRVDVIIQLGGRADDLVSNTDYVEKVNRLIGTIPMVITGKLDGTQCYQVQIDAEKAMELLMDYLIGLGHEKIALVGGSREVISTYLKYQQYLDILKRHRLPYHEEYIIDGSYNYQSGYEGMAELLKKSVLPTAVIAINDFSAAGVVRCIIDHHYRIPDDISVVSYDNTLIAELQIPKLTSIDYNYEVFGKMLVDTAIAAVENKDMPILQKVEPTLIIRESSGPKK